jgi:3-oxoacyl-[acyl-carrier-protein] synthase-3
MTPRLRARLVGLGSYVPERILSNADLEKLVDTTDEWIVSRTGIQERRIAHSEEFTSHLGEKAAWKALEAAQLTPDDIDLILVATMTPDYISPSTAALIQAKLGATRAAAADIQAACTGYIYGLSMAKAYVESGMYKRVLLIAAEKMSAFIDYKDRNTCVIFGDGASAAVVAAEGSGLAIESIHLGADGNLADLVIIPGGGSRHPTTSLSHSQGLHYFKMEGKEVFKHAVRRMGQAATECLEKVGLKKEEISWLVPHQANARIIEAISKSFEIPVFRTLHKYGNTSASSVGIALNELTLLHPLLVQQRVLLVAFGGGLTWGTALLKQVGETDE